MNLKIRVFHIEDGTLIREGVEHMLGTDPEIEYAGGKADGGNLMQILKKVQVDVLILDLYLDGNDESPVNGFQLCRAVLESFPNIKIVANSSYQDADRITRILNAGAKGFVSKKSRFNELRTAIHTVYHGGIYISEDVTRDLKNLNRFLLGAEQTLRSRNDLFSTRERSVAELLAEGKSSKEIGERLFITERTVETHRKNMLEKSNTRNSAELMAFMAAKGILKK